MIIILVMYTCTIQKKFKWQKKRSIRWRDEPNISVAFKYKNPISATEKKLSPHCFCLSRSLTYSNFRICCVLEIMKKKTQWVMERLYGCLCRTSTFVSFWFFSSFRRRRFACSKFLLFCGLWVATTEIRLTVSMYWRTQRMYTKASRLAFITLLDVARVSSSAMGFYCWAIVCCVSKW